MQTPSSPFTRFLLASLFLLPFGCRAAPQGHASGSQAGGGPGAAVALEAARLMPDRVVGLVPIDTLQDADMHPTPQQLDSFLDAFKKDFPTATRNLVRQIVPPTADPKIVASIADHMAGASSEVG